MDDLNLRHLRVEDLARLTAGAFTELEVNGRVEHLLGCRECRCLARDFIREDQIPKGLRRFSGVVKLADAEAQRVLDDLIARAEWENVRRMPKAAQKDHLVLSRACHTREFLALLLGVVRQPQSWAEAEMAARLAILSIKGLAANKWSTFESNRIVAQVWMELANSRRLAAEWDAAEDALKRASANLGDEAFGGALADDLGITSERPGIKSRCPGFPGEVP